MDRFLARYRIDLHQGREHLQQHVYQRRTTLSYRAHVWPSWAEIGRHRGRHLPSLLTCTTSHTMNFTQSNSESTLYSKTNPPEDRCPIASMYSATDVQEIARSSLLTTPSSAPFLGRLPTIARIILRRSQLLVELPRRRGSATMTFTAPRLGWEYFSPRKSALTFDYILSRLQGCRNNGVELQVWQEREW